MGNKYDLDYSDQLKELSQANPLCASIPAALMHCLTPDHLRLAVLLQTHCAPIKLPPFQIGFISDDQQPVVTTNFGNIAFSGNRVGSCITYRFDGLWVLKVEGQPFDLSLGHGALTVEAYTARSLADPDRQECWRLIR